MMQINKSLILKGCLPIAALSVMTACVDDKYDLSDIDTTSRFTVNNLTVPINLQSIKLDDVLDFDDTDLIITTTDEFGREIYAIQQGGNIETSDFSINGVHVASVPIDPTNTSIDDPQLKNPVINANFDINLPEIPMQQYHINLNNVDSSIVSIDKITTKAPIEVKIVLSIPSSIVSGNAIAFKNLYIKLPWGLITDGYNYDQTTGMLYIDNLPVDNNGQATLTIKASGMDFMGKGKLENHNLDISDQVGITSGTIHFEISNVNISGFNLHSEYYVSAFDLATFSGDIDYRMNNIDIAPIELNDLPDFLNSPETEIRIANPQININVNNPVGQYGLKGYGRIKLTSNFTGNNTTVAESDKFEIAENGANLTFGEGNYSNVAFPGLGDILANTNSGGLPSSITVNLEELQFIGHAEDFPIGNIDKAQGDYQFTAPLGFDDPSMVIYETEDAGWNSDDLDNVNIEYINLSAKCYTPELPVGIKLSVVPLDKEGNEIAVTEDSGNFEVPPMCTGKDVSLRIQAKNGPITNFDGIRFRAVISQNDPNNTQAIGPNLSIELRDLRITVDGYYETDF